VLYAWPAVVGQVRLAEIAELGARTLTSGAEEIAAVTELVQRTTGIDITVVSEMTADGRYVFRGLEARPFLPLERDAAIPYALSMCSRIHAGESPSTVPDVREVPALWEHWLTLKEGLGVDWDILAFCTRDVLLPDGERFGTLCLHHLEPREFSEDEQALLEVLARLLGLELWRERAAKDLLSALAELEHARRLRVELADELQHELRAPLQVIDGYAEAMLDGVVTRDDEHMTLVRREAGRAIQLLADIAALVRIEVDADAEGTASVRVDEVATAMRDRLAPLAESAGIELEARVAPAAVVIPEKRVEQLIVNLVRNALRAVQAGGGARIVIFVEPGGDSVAVGVEDDGPGMPAVELPRAFDRFYRGSSAAGTDSGSGLGLTIARRIVTAAGGEIEAESLTPHGLRVVARLPLAGEGAAGGDQAAVKQP
jgi:signal transduction histidine kinase